MFLFRAVLGCDSLLSAKSDSMQKLEERKKTVAGKQGSCVAERRHHSPLRNYSVYKHMKYLCTYIDKQYLPS